MGGRSSSGAVPLRQPRPHSGRRQEEARSRLRRDESGIATLAATLIMPIVVLLILSVAQYVVYYHASQLATAAAQEGVRAAQVLDATEDDGRAHAQDFLAQAGPNLVLEPSVAVTRGPEAARVEISASAPRLVPVAPLGIRAIASGPVERFVGDEAP